MSYEGNDNITNYQDGNTGECHGVRHELFNYLLKGRLEIRYIAEKCGKVQEQEYQLAVGES